jgi:hypothetical protein
VWLLQQLHVRQASVAAPCLQAGFAVASSAAAVAPDDPLVLHELAYLEAEAELWRSVTSYDDPAIYKALEVYAKRLEVRTELNKDCWTDPAVLSVGDCAEWAARVSPCEAQMSTHGGLQFGVLGALQRLEAWNSCAQLLLTVLLLLLLLLLLPCRALLHATRQTLMPWGLLLRLV